MFTLGSGIRNRAGGECSRARRAPLGPAARHSAENAVRRVWVVGLRRWSDESSRVSRFVGILRVVE